MEAAATQCRQGKRGILPLREVRGRVMIEGPVAARAGRLRKFFPGVLMVTTALVAAHHSANAQEWLKKLERGVALDLQLSQTAQTQAHHDFNIPSQPLDDALTSFGRQSG